MICKRCKKYVPYKTWGLLGEEICDECDKKDFLFMFFGTIGIVLLFILISALIQLWI